MSLLEGQYQPTLIHYPESDRLEFVTEDIPAVHRLVGPGVHLILDMGNLERCIGFAIDNVSASLA